jgi:CubicO group peptidase (beta-lactamase class C family)
MQQIIKEQIQIISNIVEKCPDGTELSIALIKDDLIINYGIKWNNGAIIPIENEASFFEIGSITKLFTATILVKVLKRHGISLDEEINKYLNVSINNGEKFTFRTLANHTAGLPPDPESIEFDETSENPFVHFKKSNFIHYIKNELIVDEDKKGKWSYSNVGIAILGYALTLIEKKNFREMVDSYVFSVYDMPTSTYNRSSINGDVVSGQNSKGEPISPWGFAEMDAPVGGVLSTVKELSKFVMANFDEREEALKDTRKRTYIGQDYFDVALCWGIIKTKNYHFHGGATRGHGSMLILNQQKKNGVIVLSNISAYHKEIRELRNLGIELLDSM